MQNTRGPGFGSTPSRQSKDRGMDPATPNFEPKASNNGVRWSPHPAAVAAGCTYSNPMTRMHDTVKRLETELVAQKMTTKQELERMKRDFIEAKETLATREDLSSAKLGLLFEATDMKDEIRQNRENIAVTQDAVKSDFGVMYELLKNLQSTTARLEKENGCMLAAMQSQGQRLEIEAPSGVRMIEAAPSREAATCIKLKDEQHFEQKTTEEAVDAASNTASHSKLQQAVESPVKEPGKANGPVEASDRSSTPKTSNEDAAAAALVRHDSAKAIKAKAWLPSALRQLKPTKLVIPSAHIHDFTSAYLDTHLGGTQLSPSLVFSNPFLLLRGRAYWLLEGVYEPFAPASPGLHGAKLTPFFNNDITGEDCNNVPVFVSTGGKLCNYTYMGHYSQPRCSDKLSHSEMMDHVPKRVLRYWNENLAHACRPEWLTMQLMEQLCPLPSDATELADWQKSTSAQAEVLTEANVAALWNKADADQPKGLRLWWEYLECVAYDQDFYEKLVAVGCEHKAVNDVAAKNEVGSEEAVRADDERETERKSSTANPDHVAGKNDTGGGEATKAEKEIELESGITIQSHKDQSSRFAKMDGDRGEKQAEHNATGIVPFTYGSTFTPRKKRFQGA